MNLRLQKRKVDAITKIVCSIGILILLALIPVYGLKPLSFEDRLKRANRDLHVQKYDPAIRQLLILIDEYPGHSQAPVLLLQVADAYRLAKQANLALQTYDLIGTRYPSTSYALQALEEKADLLFGQERFDQALNAYQALILNFPSSENIPSASLRLGICHLKQNQFEPARRMFDLLIASEDSKLKSQALFYKGNSYLLENRFDDAIGIYDSFLKNYPGHDLTHEVKFNLADSYENLGKYDLALEIYLELQKTYPNPRVIELQIQRNKEKNKEAAEKKKQVGI